MLMNESSPALKNYTQVLYMSRNLQNQIENIGDKGKYEPSWSSGEDLRRKYSDCAQQFLELRSP